MLEPAWLQELADSPFKPEKRTSSSAYQDERKRSAESKRREDLPDASPGAELKEETVAEALVDTVGRQDTEEAAALEAAYRTHEAHYLSSLLAATSLGEEWRPLLLRLAEETVCTVLPDTRQPGTEEMDVRAYVKVKVVEGGRREESRLVAGEVCSLQLAHKGMASSIQQPRIALVANSIMFQREEGRFVSLDTLAMQEEEYIKNVTGRLLACRPSVVLVERTVSRLAQEIFLREGVSLALNVKHRVLTRLARLTQGSIISSVDSMLAPPRLGSCERFLCRREGRARLLVFEGCQPSLGGTILLQGGDLSSLVRAKAVLKRLLLLKQTWRGEKALLANEYGALAESQEHEEMEVQLAVSPFIRLSPLEVILPHVVEAEDVTDDQEIEEEGVESEFVGTEVAEDVLHPWARSFLGQAITGPEDVKVQDQLALFRAGGRRLSRPGGQESVGRSRRVRGPPLPDDHCESLSVQFSMYSSQSCLAPNYCVAPWVVRMVLYANLDISLGEFLESQCFDPDYLCPARRPSTPHAAVCLTPPLLHTRRFCHAGGAVSLHMQRLEAPILGEVCDIILFCPKFGHYIHILPFLDNIFIMGHV